MTKYVLDASALLALVQNEKGAAVVIEHLASSVICSVNYSETISKLLRHNVPFSDAKNIVMDLAIPVIDFDGEMADESAKFKEQTRSNGLSLGDCACLALAKVYGYDVITADAIWKKANSGVNIVLIR